jgi:predicted acylesterase/phospholipase RssA
MSTPYHAPTTGAPHALHLGALALVLLLSACVSSRRPDSLPFALRDQAQPLGIPDLRIYPERLSAASNRFGWQITWRPASIKPASFGTVNGSRDLLAISAGGDGGAFSAGFLIGWSQTGMRPTFAVVTGVSAGALIAPFAYLGPSYDHVLREVSLATRPGKFFLKRGIVAGLLGDGLESSEPLQRLLVTYVTPELMQEIARAYHSGRDLYIMTTDLDAGTPVIWNMGAIAASGSPAALDLFRQVMLASASTPAAVSPVLIDVTAGGRHYREIHVDGAVTHQVFIAPFSSTEPPTPPMATQPSHRSRAFIIMNTTMEMSWSPTPRRTLKIGSRAIDTMIQTAARSDVDGILAALQRQGIEPQLAYVDSGFHHPHPREFDPSYTRALFFYGLRLASAEYAWHSAPPEPQEPGRGGAVVASMPDRP